MKGKFFANLLALLIPSKNLRHKLRRWSGFMTQKDRIERELAYIKRMLQLSLPTSSIPPTQGLARGIQLLILEKMQELAELFTKKHIEYWLDFGSLLGAVRHKGFVPWDEDLDIAIDKENREAVIELLKDNGIEYTTAHGENSLLQIPIIKVKGYVVHIDIMSYVKVEGVSETGILQAENIMKKANRQFSCYSDTYHQSVMTQLRKLPSEAPGDKAIYVRCVDCCLIYPSYVVEDASIFPLKSMPFENANFNVPQKTAEYLTCLYKDYMQWPPTLYTNDISTRMQADSRLQLIELLKASDTILPYREKIGI